MNQEKVETKYLAHIRYDGEVEVYHLLEEHLTEVGRLAARFAGRYGGLFAQQVGLLHDLGKAQESFRRYILTSAREEKENAHIENARKGRIMHSTAGAKYAITTFKKYPFIGAILAYLIAGHHAGLADWSDKRSLAYRLAHADEELQGSLDTGFPIQNFVLAEDALGQELVKFFSKGTMREELHVWMRMVFSCLVDADFLDTEAFMKGYANADEAKTHGLRPTFPSLIELQTRYQQHMQQLAVAAQGTPLQKIRAEILDNCLSKAEEESNIFSLTVPTGGGKTLASLGFALKHALKFGKERIIYAIPFTSIIEQNASVFRRALGEDALIEHHSNLDVDAKNETMWRRIATENWDAPLVVTTNVQFFESLFATRPSRCRKLHNIVNSVVILDEAQQLPRDFQKPITDMMRVLAKDYGVTFVLCTATQPELGEIRDAFDNTLQQGLGEVSEIIDNPTGLADKLKRVNVRFPADSNIRQSWQEIADEISQKDCVLAVVNTRNQAKKLFKALPDTGIKLHLSANMCAEHRSEVLALVRLYLQAYHEGKLEKPLWLVSTQLIEAGVDVDFPVVYRQMAGLDSIAQAAGRCNREGKLSSLGEVVVFRAEEGVPSGSLKQGQVITEELLGMGGLHEPLSPATFKNYFERFNTKGSTDKHGISKDLSVESSKEAPICLKFQTASDKFRMIDQNGIALVVPHRVLRSDNHQPVSSDKLSKFFEKHKDELLQESYPDNVMLFKDDNSTGDLPEQLETWFRCLEEDASNTWVYRKLQRYTITVPEHYLKSLPDGAVYERAGVLVLSAGFYSEIFGAERLDDAYDVKVESMVI